MSITNSTIHLHLRRHRVPEVPVQSNIKSRLLSSSQAEPKEQLATETEEEPPLSEIDSHGIKEDITPCSFKQKSALVHQLLMISRLDSNTSVVYSIFSLFSISYLPVSNLLLDALRVLIQVYKIDYHGERVR
jgi:hypothetical protein